MRNESPHSARPQRPDIIASVHAAQETFGAIIKLDLSVLREVFPGWRLNGAPDHWFAVRGGSFALVGPRSLLRCYLRASTLVGLAEQLCLQEYLDGLSDQELTNIWQRAELPGPTKQARS